LWRGADHAGWQSGAVKAVCVSKGCTTGWLDWVHGELWLLPDALVRRRLTFATTQANRYGPTVGDPLPERDPGSFRRDDIRHRTDKFLPFATIRTAQLFRGFTAHGLALSTVDGRKHKLLWLTADPAYEILSESLPALLGGRLVF
jgi:hypothetical protein